jgi:two-component system, chemotaxis family, sensor kinase CheA
MRSELAMAKQFASKTKGRTAPVPLAGDISNLAGSLEAAEPRQLAAAGVDPGSVRLSASSQSLNQDPELLREFLVEAREHLTSIESRLLEFDQGNSSGETLHSVFRSFHTLKGLAGFLEFGVLQEVAHEVETVLDRARNDELQISPGIVDVILEVSDYIAVWLNHISSVAEGRSSEAPPSPEALINKVHATASTASAELGQSATSFALQEATNSLAPAEEPLLKSNQPESAATLDTTRREESSVVKVATSKLEYLVDMVGELVIAESLLHHNPDLATIKTPRVQRNLAHLGRITAEVQKTAMAMRMVPVGHLFRRMVRLVRDLGRKSGKKADLELFGEDVELDRRLVEELSDPLVHMIRNSMDHGLEAPEDRIAAGKPEIGRIRLAAKHQAGEIHIEIADDGRGLNRERILAKAVERGIVGAGEHLSDSEIYHLIFRPGFSTAEKVTEVSGRGVGMDVVWRHLLHLRGRAEIRSTPGQGSQFLLRLPLTMAIIDGLVVLCGEERYIVPIFSVREMFRPTLESIFTVQGKGEMVLVRGQLLPLVRLKQRLNLRSGVNDPCQGLIIVGESEARRFCLLVDALAGKQEVVIKSLGPQFSQIQGLAGGAILGDGRVGLILDLSALLGGGLECRQARA